MRRYTTRSAIGSAIAMLIVRLLGTRIVRGPTGSLGATALGREAALPRGWHCYRWREGWTFQRLARRWPADRIIRRWWCPSAAPRWW